MTAFIYRHPWVYRATMTLLYGKYERRYSEIVSLVPAPSFRVTELCFGDVVLAQKLTASGDTWVGIELSRAAVARARRKGFTAIEHDASDSSVIPPSDVIICQGSLYHFKEVAAELIATWCDKAPLVIVSEPTTNWASRPGLVGGLARTLTRTDLESGSDRFDARSFRELVTEVEGATGRRVSVLSTGRDTIAVFQASAEHGG